MNHVRSATVALVITCCYPQPCSSQDSGEQLPRDLKNSIEMELVLIRAGRFQMGSARDDLDPRRDEMPRHSIEITSPFYIGKYEVTQAEYMRIFPDRKSFFRWPDGDGKDRVKGLDTTRFPAELVKWVDAADFCRKLSELPEEKAAGRFYRLPTEAEWEYACRAGTRTAFHFGDSLNAQQANFLGTFPFGQAEPGLFRSRTTKVGSFAPNAFGLFDMHGNVWEWCADWYGRDYYANSPNKDPRGPKSGSRKVLRGGDWFSDGRDCRSAFRYAGLPYGTFYATGMRVVMTYTKTPATIDPPPPLNAGVGPLSPETTDQPSTPQVGGADWPRWRGARGDGTWNGPELPAQWPKNGLRRMWRQPIGPGYGGVAVANGRVYVMDRRSEPEPVERLLCFNAASGRSFWTESRPADYSDVAYDKGPRTTPAISGGSVYTLGATGQVVCRDAETGATRWSTDLVADHHASIPLWGFCASPFVSDELLIVQAGSQPNGCLIAFDRATGKKIWNSLADNASYSTPIVIHNQGSRQVVCWTASHVRSVELATGKPLWSVPYPVESGMAIATPVYNEGLVVVCGYYDGTKAIRLGENPAEANVVWEERRNLRGHMSQPLVRDGYVYLLDRRHGLTCFEMATGRKLWDAENRVTVKARNPQATMVWAGQNDRALILNSDGELILARVNPSGYHEQSRTRIIGETWAHPAYAGSRVFARSDTELVSYSLVNE